jgi:hypothetical protein
VDAEYSFLLDIGSLKLTGTKARRYDLSAYLGKLILNYIVHFRAHCIIRRRRIPEEDRPARYDFSRSIVVERRSESILIGGVTNSGANPRNGVSAFSFLTWVGKDNKGDQTRAYL